MSRSTIKKALYLSGPMTGLPDYNYPAFHAAAGKLRKAGWAVINPAESYNGDQSLSFDTYMRHDLKQILDGCDSIVVLPGWEDSPGAVLEVAVGVGLGYGILEYEGSLDDGATLKSLFPVHDTNRERLEFLFRIGRYDDRKDVKQEEPVEKAKAYAEMKRVGVISEGFTPGPEPLTSWAAADNELLKEADRIVNSDRQRTYGHPITHHTATAAMWSAYLTRVNGEQPVTVRPQDVSILMVLDKASRIGGGDKVDNALDIAGYAQVHAKVRARQETSNGGVFE